MSYRPIRFLFALLSPTRLLIPLSIAALLAALVVGCATVQNTSKQDYTWELGKACNTSEVFMERVNPDGRYFVWTRVDAGSTKYPGYFACMREQFKARPYLDWLKARQASAPQSDTMPSPASPPNVAGPIMAPIWHVGDEWEYAYKSPSDSGTFVWSVSRVETLDGEPNYVLKIGTREILHRVSDLANTLERVDGVVVLRETPARLMYAWPLVVGKSWDETHKQERPVERSTTDRNSTWTVDTEETVTVLAGTFRTVKITWKNKNTGALVTEMWYAPDVKQWVKIREVLTNGIREREMVSFKLK